MRATLWNDHPKSAATEAVEAVAAGTGTTPFKHVPVLELEIQRRE